MPADMIGVLIITHGNLGREMLAAVERMLGRQERVEVLPVNPGDGLDGIRQSIKSLLEGPGFSEGCIILVDIMGGTPANASLAFAGKSGVEILGGLNLPALVALFAGRAGTPREALVKKVLDAGTGGVVDVKNKMIDRLGEKNEHNPCQDR